MQLSVIIPAYNCENTLVNTVESIAASGIYDYEIIIVDDGSSDKTRETAEGLVRIHPEIRCVSQKNAGASAARNRGLDEARGEYIWFADADDTVDAWAMSRAADIAARQRPDMLIFGMSFDYYRRGRLYRRDKLVPPCEGMLTPERIKEEFHEFYACNALTPVWNKLIRREIMIKSGVCFREDMILMEDYLLVLELLPHCRTVYSLPEVIYRYRQPEDEKGAYRRLMRICSLAEYVRPFEDGMRALDIPEGETANLYQMLLGQKLYYAPLAKIREISAAHKKSRYAYIQLGSPLGIYLRNKKTQLRHRIAVRVKSSAVYRRIKGAAD